MRTPTRESDPSRFGVLRIGELHAKELIPACFEHVSWTVARRFRTTLKPYRWRPFDGPVIGEEPTSGDNGESILGESEIVFIFSDISLVRFYSRFLKKVFATYY